MATQHPVKKSIHSSQYKVFVRQLRRLRQAANLSQEQLAAKLGKSQSFVSKCERGERRLDVIELRQFCLVLGARLSQFVAQLERHLS